MLKTHPFGQRIHVLLHGIVPPPPPRDLILNCPLMRLLISNQFDPDTRNLSMFVGDKEDKTMDELRAHKYYDTNTTTQILRHKYYDKNTTTQILRHKYYDTNTTTQILRHKYYDTNTTTQMLCHKIL